MLRKTLGPQTHPYTTLGIIHFTTFTHTHTRACVGFSIGTGACVRACSPSGSLKVEPMETSCSSLHKFTQTRCITARHTHTHTHTHTRVPVLLFSSSFTHQLSSLSVSAGLSTPFISVSAAPLNA